MKKILISIFCIFTLTNIHANNEVIKKVLIFTKNGLSLNGKKGYVHENIPNSIKALQEICKLEKIETVASEDASLFTDETLAQFDAIIFSNANNEVFDTEEQKQAFQRYIRNGGGFIGIHSANAVERGWPWYWALIGGKFVRHAPHQEFDVIVTNPSHPSTEFLGKKWTVNDECYYSNNLNPDINVLLSADMTTVEDKKKSEYPNNIFGNYFPICWSHEFEGGRQWYTALGHDSETYDNPIFRKHLKGGILWVLNKK
nr:ThuA domain-containing protein [Gaetbulibacter sp. 4G1]